MQGSMLALSVVVAVEIGLIYALIAIGFSLIYGVGRVLFCAHGEVYMVGALGAFILIQKVGMPFFETFVIIVLGCGLFGLALERLVFRRLRDELTVYIWTLGLAMVMANLCLLIVSGRVRGIPPQFPGQITVSGMSLPIDRLILIGISAAIIVALNWFLNNVRAGQAIRAVAQNPEAAVLQGINKNRSMQLVFFVALCLAGAAGVLIAPIYYVDVFMGTPALLTTFLVVILGGLGSIPGAILAGLFLGFLQTFGGIFIGGLTTLVAFISVIIVLVVRPRGFLGRG